MFKNIKKKVLLSNPFLFLLILLLSLIFRVTNLGLIEFKTDEAINLLLASRPLFGHPFAPGGTVSSIGILNPPLFTYLLFPLTVISLDPRWISFSIALINSISIAFLFLVIKKYYNKNIALISTILMAFSPWAIIYSRKIWTQDLLIPFFVPFFYSLHKLLIEKKQIFWIPYAIFALFLIQLHQIIIVFIAIITAFLLLQKIKINVKYILVGSAIGIVPLIPYALFELNNNCPDCKTFIAAINKFSPQRSFEIFSRPLQITSQGGFRFILGNDTLTFAQKFPLIDNLRKVFYLEYLLTPLGVFIFVKKFKKTKIIAYSVILLPIAYFLLKLDPFMHYYIIIMPILFLFLATSLDYLLSNKNLFTRIGAITILILIIAQSIMFNLSFFKLLELKQFLEGDYGRIYSATEKEVKKKLFKFESYSDYNEIFLSSFIPLNYVYGYLPLGEILYGDTTDNDMVMLEEKLKEKSDDPRIKQELISFYTKDKPDLQTLTLLKEKTLNIPEYESLYKNVLGEYLWANFKKEYLWHKGGLRLFYPEHWKVEEKNKELIIFGDGYSLSIDENRSYISNKKTPVIDDIIESIEPL
ncbi:MAG: glycosyltransferase family 39 protein [Patescibacteria group bacterium]